MEENSACNSGIGASRFAAKPRSARTRMLVYSILILLAAALVLFGVILFVCFVIIKCGFVASLA